jgi:antitoxin component of MazEF toxin-antitoxin module
VSQVIVGKWGKNLAVRVPQEVARASGLSDGEKVEIEVIDGDILIRRPSPRTLKHAAAKTAAAEIIAESKRYSLGGVSIRELIQEGRRG